MEETISVTQLNTRVKSLFGSTPSVNDIWVAGEISNFKAYGSGHYYFTLKDSGSEIRCAMFKSSRSRIDFEPTDNMKVAVFGRLDMYVERGSYQFVVETMKRFGLGELYEAFEALKKKLDAEGLFDPARKRKLPLYPKTIGVVTSPTGAVIHDIITTSGRRFPADILLAPAKVQGDGAAESVVAGIKLLNKAKVDVIIVGRGGGSLEDLWAFNEEIVARAIASSAVPIISAVGHETDFTIADMVADVRAPTPTGAAEIALRDKKEIIRQLDVSTVRMGRALNLVLGTMKHRFEILDMKLSPKKAEERVAMLSIRLDNFTGRLASALNGIAGNMRRRLTPMESSIENIGEDIIGRRKIRLDTASDRLDALSPYRVLDRGYGMVTGPDGRTVTSVTSLAKGSSITVRFRNGAADATIREVRKDDGKKG